MFIQPISVGVANGPDLLIKMERPDKLSGIQSGYVICPLHGPKGKCRKYQRENIVSSRVEFAARFAVLGGDCI